MTTTRANVEAAIVADLGAWMAAAGLAVTIVGTNASLNNPIGWAIRMSGGTTAAPALVTDADVATVSTSYYDQLIALAELKTLEAIYQGWTAVDVRGLSFEESGDQFGKRVWAALQAKREEVEGVYGIGGYGAFSVTLTRTDGYSELAAEDV